MPAAVQDYETAMRGRHGLVDRLAGNGGDPVSWGREGRLAALGDLEGLRGWLDAREAVVLRVCHLERDDVNSGAKDLIQLSRQTGNVSFGEAKRRALRAEHLRVLPGTAAALEAGVLGVAQADELVALADRLEPDQIPALTAAEECLVEELCKLTPVRARRRLLEFEAEISTDDGKSKLERQQAENRLRLPKNSDGTTGIHGQVDPVSGAYLRTCIDAKVSEMWRREAAERKHGDAAPAEVMSNERRRAEALIELVREAHEGTSSSKGAGGGAEILVLIDYQTLLGQLAETDIAVCRLGDGTPIPADVARRLACEAGIIPVVLAGKSQPLDVGRASRLATPAQRAALRAVHDSCCVGSCDVPYEYTQIHHVRPWDKCGRTDIDDLAPVCNKCHHLIHDNGWILALDRNRVGTLTRDPTKTANTAKARRTAARSADPADSNPDPFPLKETEADRAPRPEDAAVPMRC